MARLKQPSLNDSFGYNVRRTHGALVRVLEHRLAAHDISAAMWFSLRLLWLQDGLSQRAISDELGLAPPTTVSMMDNLEHRGFVRRVRAQEDRRVVNIFLTPAGKRLAGELLHHADAVNEIALAPLSVSERKTLKGLLARARAAIEAVAAET